MDGDIFTNMNHSIYTMFPQLCAPIHAVNKYGEDSISVLSSPIVLKETYQSKKRDDLFFAGQLTGVEGYVESCASGLIAGINMSLYMQGKEPICFGNTCVMGSQAYYITHCDPKHFQPMNANFGIMHLNEKCKKHERKEKFAAQALSRIQEIQEQVNG